MKTGTVLAVAVSLACSAAVRAGETNWILVPVATDILGMHSGRFNAKIGAIAGFTDGVDPSKGEPAAAIDPPPGLALAYSPSLLAPGLLSFIDFRAPLAPGDRKVWTLLVYEIREPDRDGTIPPSLGTIKLTFAPHSNTAYALSFSISGYPAYYTLEVPGYDLVRFTSGPINWSGTLPAVERDQAHRVYFTVVVAPEFAIAVPEPGSLLGLVSLLGIGAWRLRRRRAEAGYVE